MCIIAIKPKGKKMFDENTIRTMFENNFDGAGFMYYDNNLHKVVIDKGYMTCESLINALKQHDFTNTNLILHFRIGTSGLRDKLNCHPYPIYAKNSLKCVCDIAMAHNGILKDYTPYRYVDVNDTQLFIEYALKPLSKGFINNKDIKHLIGEIIGNNNKLAFLDSDNKVTMINHFIEDNGYYYSNNSYKPKKIRQTDVCIWDDYFPSLKNL